MIVQKFKYIRDTISLSRKAFASYRYQILLLVVLGFLSGLLEGIGINVLIPLLSSLIGESSGDDIITQALQSVFAFLHIDFSFRYLLLLVVILFVLKGFVLFVFNYVKIKIVASYEANLRGELFKGTLQSRWSSLLKQKLGHLETVLIVNVRSSARMLDDISQLIISVSGLLVFALIAFNISPGITAITLIIGVVAFFSFKPLMALSRRVAGEAVVVNRDTAHYINENILGMKTVKSLVTEEKITLFGSKQFERLRALRVRTFLLRVITSITLQPIGVIFISIIFVYSYTLSTFQFSAFIAIVYLIQRIFVYIQQLIEKVQHLNEMVPYLKNVLEYRQQIKDNAELKGGDVSFDFNSDLSFKNVTFAYPDGKEVLSNINLTIKKGGFIGLIGSSGSGKTTVVDLILRLFSPTGGVITLDGKDIADTNLKEWRKRIGYISQDIFLMNDTVENNIKFYDESLTSEEVKEAARKAHIYDDITMRPDGFKTNVGERGILFSAGQRQRIVIARILARNPDILILDEATSALDNESEIQIQKVIQELKGKVTVLAIAHRLSTIKSVDKLLVLEKGHIVEEGEPKTLLRDKNSYFYKVSNIRG